jgi:serine/threonine protein kinase
MGNLLAERYRVEKKIGEGSYSIVYKGFDIQKNRMVAIKELKSGNLTPQEAEEARLLFFKEIEFLQTLAHDSIPKYYDFIFEGERYYLVMEWIDGKDLLLILEEEGKFSQAKALDYMAKICGALCYLQGREAPIIFKDLKPSNILVNSKGTIKLIDFGTARIFSSKKKCDTCELGTPGYAPPEAYGKAVQTDLSADVYSLGATIYHLVTGQEPFQFRFNFPSPKLFNPSISDNFQEILLGCLRKREQRIPDSYSLGRRILKIAPNLSKLSPDLPSESVLQETNSAVTKIGLVVLAYICYKFYSSLPFCGTIVLVGLFVTLLYDIVKKAIAPKRPRNSSNNEPNIFEAIACISSIAILILLLLIALVFS